MRLLVISVFPPAKLAEADHAYHLCSQLADEGVEVHVLSQRGSSVPARPGLHVHPLMRDWSWRELPRLAACLRKTSPDAVLLLYVGHMYNFQPAMTYAATLAKQLLPGKPVFTMFEHVAGLPAKERVLREMPRRGVNKLVRIAMGRHVSFRYGTLLRDSDRIVVLTGSHLYYLDQDFPGVEAKSVLIPPPALMMMAPADDGVRERRRQALGVRPGDTLLVYFGYLYHNKGLETLLPALEILCRGRNDVHLMLVGGTVQDSSDHSPGYAQEMRRLADSLECRDKIHFTGGYEWDSDEASQRLRAADIAVLPFDRGARLNNSSVAGVVAHGLPLVTTQAEPAEPQFVHEENALLVPPQDPAALASAVRRILDEAPLREKLREGARRLADDWFSPSANAGRLIAAFDEATVEHRVGQTMNPIKAPL